MRIGMTFAAAALATVAAGSLFSTTASAAEWCGYAAKDNAVIECGYSTAEDCETITGKGGMCFIDPDYAFNERRGWSLALGTSSDQATGRRLG
jgi:hypothetical protein